MTAAAGLLHEVDDRDDDRPEDDPDERGEGGVRQPGEHPAERAVDRVVDLLLEVVDDDVLLSHVRDAEHASLMRRIGVRRSSTASATTSSMSTTLICPQNIVA